MAQSPLSKEKQKTIAKERIATLFAQAAVVFASDRALANRYVSLARKLQMKVRVRLPLAYKRRFCKHCYKYMLPGVNCRVRNREGKVVISCLECKKFTRIPTGKKTIKKDNKS